MSLAASGAREERKKGSQRKKWTAHSTLLNHKPFFLASFGGPWHQGSRHLSRNQPGEGPMWSARGPRQPSQIWHSGFQQHASSRPHQGGLMQDAGCQWQPHTDMGTIWVAEQDKVCHWDATTKIKQQSRQQQSRQVVARPPRGPGWLMQQDDAPAQHAEESWQGRLLKPKNAPARRMQHAMPGHGQEWLRKTWDAPAHGARPCGQAWLKRDAPVHVRQPAEGSVKQGQAWGQERYKVRMAMVNDIILRLGVTPTVDAFADEDMHVVRRWWGPGSLTPDAMATSWTNEVLWLNPPFSMFPQVVEKLVAEGGKAIVIAPHWKNQPWFQKLQNMTVKRHFYASGRRFFEDTGPLRWPVWALLVEGSFKTLDKFEPEKIRTTASKRRFRRKWQSTVRC